MLTVRDATPVAATPPGPQPPGPEAPPRRSLTGANPDAHGAATVALVALTVISSAGLVRVFTGHGWLGPLLITAVGVQATCWAARRYRLPQLVALGLALVAVWLLTAWTVLGSSTNYGFPAGRTASQLWQALGQARSDFATAVTPVPVTTGFKLLVVLGTGLVVILADWGAFRWRSALYGVAPPFAYFVVCCALGAGAGREWVVSIEVAGLVVFLLVHRATVGRADQAWFGNQRAGTARWAVSAGSVAAVAAVLVAVVITPAVGTTEGRGVLGWRAGFGNAGNGPRQVPNPIVDLHTRLLVESDTPVFTVQSPVASYWRLTSLDTFTGQDWISTNSYRSFGKSLPGIQAVPPGTRVVQEQFLVQQLGSVWLPDAFTPLAVDGVRGVSYDPTSGSLITSHATSDGLAYSVTSYQYLSSLDPAQLQSAPPVTIAGSLRQYTALPRSVPASVYALARSITAGQTTEYGKALALQNYFLSPLFTYSLSPPNDGYGVNALTNFLFTSRTGYCQQFAGAYAVLARAIGLPTRLAVGFATGTDEGNGYYQVLNADAHTWPEIYFGPQYGWLPFEPTKSYADPASKGYAPPSSGGTGTGPETHTAVPAPAPKGGGALTGPAGAKNNASPTTLPGNQGAGQSADHQGGLAGLALGLLLLAFVAWSALVAADRRARWALRRWKARGDPAGQVRSHWADVTELLSWWGASQEAGETDAEFARRAGPLLVRRLREPSPWLPGGITRLAGLATEAAFAKDVSSERAHEAALVAQEIHQRLFRSATARQLLRWAVVPRPAGRDGLSAGREPNQKRQVFPGPWPSAIAGGARPS
jgi:transglutaminase-like putative cysteine protease